MLGATAAAQRTPLNFVFVLADDLGWRDLACYGDPFHETPNLDRLASQGVRFTSAYTACPVCSPTRASIMTGKSPGRLKLTSFIPGRAQWPASPVVMPQFRQQLPLEEVTLAEVLKGKGYRTGQIGKWHLGAEGFQPVDQGFDYGINVRGKGTARPALAPVPQVLPPDPLPYEQASSRIADESVAFVGKHKQDPFFLYVCHHDPHIPLRARPDLVAKYERKAQPAGARKWNPAYAAMIEQVDQAMGRLLTAIDDAGVADRTVVVFTSDNGGLRFENNQKEYVTDNTPLRAGKGHLYEGGIRVPSILRWPGVARAGSTSDLPFSTVDYMNTFAMAAGAMPPRNEGQNLRPLLMGGRIQPKPLYWHFPHYSNQGSVPSGAVRSGAWKLIEFYEDGRLELFNVVRDIGETRNLIQKEPERAKRLHAMLKKWRQDGQMDMPVPNPNYDPAKADQGLTGVEKPTPPV
jgi:arylsulfatase A-like enzyme